jgi:hypothetical protein
MALFKLMFIIEYRKNPTMSYLRIKLKFFIWFTSKYGDKWSICDKMTLCARMGGLWGDLTTIVWIVKYLQRSIYIWNKISKYIVFQCGMDHFQPIPLHIAYNFHHFEPIEYVSLVYLDFHLFPQQTIPKFT